MLVKIADIAAVKGGKRLPKGEELTSLPTDNPYIRAQDIREGKITIDDPKFLTPEQHQRLKRYIVAAGDVCIVIVGANVGDVGIVPKQLHGANLTENAVKLTNFRHDCIPQYVNYCLSAPDAQAQMQQIAGGAAQPKLGIYKVLDVEIPFHPKNTQDRIASILSAYDDLIENNARRIKILEDMAQMLYREWFVNFRFPGHQKVKMVDSELGPIPVAWTVEPLEAVCKRVTDGSHWSPQTVESVHLMASSKDMHRWGLTLSTCRTIAKEDFDTLVRNDCKPLAGDVLITKDGANYLKFCFTVENDMDVVLLSSVAIIRPNPIRASSHFLAFYLSDESVKTRLAGRVSGAAIPRIVLKDFRYFKVVVPPMAIQNHFVQIVEPMVALCWRLINKNTNLRSTRDFLLPKLISGEVPVQAAAEAMEQTA